MRVLAGFVLAAGVGLAAEAPTATVAVRGRSQIVRLYGPRDGPPAIVASGDGGWVHLGPEVAAFLGARGWSITGVDAKAYLSSFTEGKRALTTDDVPGDFRAFVEFARQGRATSVLLVGVSEGAGLAVLAASEPALRRDLLGVVGLGLPNVNELGWRWKDAIIYVTRKTPDEPTFRAADFVGKLDALPLAAVHSTHDEFVPLEEITRLMALPGGTKRLWVVPARDHRFSDNADGMQRSLLQAIDWIKAGGR
jgi:alpha-beta hydrolase superfamily lysophospholipase